MAWTCRDDPIVVVGTKKRFWARSWHLSATVAHSWRAHKEGLRLAAVSEMEDMAVSAGKGMAAGREGDVLRVWDLATCRAGEHCPCCVRCFCTSWAASQYCLQYTQSSSSDTSMSDVTSGWGNCQTQALLRSDV